MRGAIRAGRTNLVEVDRASDDISMWYNNCFRIITLGMNVIFIINSVCVILFYNNWVVSGWVKNYLHSIWDSQWLMRFKYYATWGCAYNFLAGCGLRSVPVEKIGSISAVHRMILQDKITVVWHFLGPDIIFICRCDLTGGEQKKAPLKNIFLA